MIKENMEEAKSGFAKHIGGLTTKKINDSNYEFYTEVKDINLNTSKIAHGGFICSIADTGMGNAAHRVIENKRCVTISLDVKFISAASLGQKLLGKVKIQKKTRTLVFVTCEISNSENIVATASGVWKIL
ncbi:MAG: PaaI family thioesterase [Flavobacteriales bacterium]|jgi:uncharacterized protein (TIGR00369 family)|nr:PaaI family thioesterase [Flavobacteriales bacterium]